ncbi:uncharacterized protein RCO7_04689 [Rhynchosporium graminicola]|uniref:Uncharacterized protein n=1 Tax=Rhynchosporium graminicola TaxID=2792576 RepID=A0A1E1JTH2_9HELO|nr:uncharacterized protein RCO7_04689 [Rhynchosporium commune]
MESDLFKYTSYLMFLLFTSQIVEETYRQSQIPSNIGAMLLRPALCLVGPLLDMQISGRQNQELLDNMGDELSRYSFYFLDPDLLLVPRSNRHIHEHSQVSYPLFDTTLAMYIYRKIQIYKWRHLAIFNIAFDFILTMNWLFFQGQYKPTFSKDSVLLHVFMAITLAVVSVPVGLFYERDLMHFRYVMSMNRREEDREEEDREEKDHEEEDFEEEDFEEEEWEEEWDEEWDEEQDDMWNIDFWEFEFPIWKWWDEILFEQGRDFEDRDYSRKQPVKQEVERGPSREEESYEFIPMDEDPSSKSSIRRA